MAILDGATSFSSDMDEETQRWVEASNSEAINSKPTSPEPLHSRANKDVPTTPPSRTQPHSTTLQQDRNTFEESFAAALSCPQTTYDGHFDNNEYDDQTPLLNAYYNSTSNNNHASSQPSHHAPLEPPSKSKPSLSICLWHEVCHNSQYTRPATEILREVLEERYPLVSPSEGEAAQELLSGEERSPKRRWWNRVIRRCARA